MDDYDLDRFIESVEVFNRPKPVGSIFENRFEKDEKELETLADLVCYCLNPNHFHFILKQKSENGIQKFMQKLGTGYTNYFNEKHKRSGALFQGRYKAVHIESNEQLLHTSVYVNLNNQLGSSTPKLSRSSWEEYMALGVPSNLSLCEKDVILEQFKTMKEYKDFANSSRELIIYQKQNFVI
ncbi:MAG: transposase [Patescibacteria group bacterium]